MRNHIMQDLGIKYVGKFQLKTSFLTKVFLNKKIHEQASRWVGGGQVDF